MIQKFDLEDSKKGMEGEANTDKDGGVEVHELAKYVQEKVKEDIWVKRRARQEPLSMGAWRV